MYPLQMLAKCPFTKCPLTKCPLAKRPLAKCPLAICPDTEFYMLMSTIDVFFVTSFLCWLKFVLFHRIEYPKRCP